MPPQHTSESANWDTPDRAAVDAEGAGSESPNSSGFRLPGSLSKWKERAEEAWSTARRWWDTREMRAKEDPEATYSLVVRLELIAQLFDGLQIPVGDQKLSVGADFFLSLLPGGALVSTGTHLYIVAEAVRFGAPGQVLERLLGRMALDASLNALPVVGSVLDGLHHSHSKNARDLAGWLEEQIPVVKGAGATNVAMATSE